MERQSRESIAAELAFESNTFVHALDRIEGLENVPMLREQDCRAIQENFSLKLEEELEIDERSIFDKHLERCSQCRESYEEFRSSVEALRSIHSPPLPVEFLPTLHERIQVVTPKRTSWIPWIIAAASFLLWLSPVGSPFDWIPSGPSQDSRKLTVRVGHGVLLVRDDSRVPLSSGDLVELSPGDIIQAAPAYPALSAQPKDKAVAGVLQDMSASFHRLFVDLVDRVERYQDLSTQPESIAPEPIEARPIWIDPRPLVASLNSIGTKTQAYLKALVQQRESRDPAPKSLSQELAEAVSASSQVVPTSVGRPTREPVRITRRNRSVSLQTRGSPSDVIPSLLVLLDDPDPSISSAAQGHLQSIYDRLSKDRSITSPDLYEPISLEEWKSQSASTWEQWWYDNRVAIAATTPE